MPTTGIYVAEFYGTDIFGYRGGQKANKGPICTVQGVSDVNGIAVDGKGNLIDPDGGSEYVYVYQGPTMCGGKQIGLIADTIRTARRRNQRRCGNRHDRGRQHSRIQARHREASSICSIKAGCTTNLTNRHDLSRRRRSDVARRRLLERREDQRQRRRGLDLFKGCKGGGVVATGFKSTYYGGIDIDNKGNLVIIDDDGDDHLPSTAAATRTARSSAVPSPSRARASSASSTPGNSEYIAVDRTDGLRRRLFLQHEVDQVHVQLRPRACRPAEKAGRYRDQSSLDVLEDKARAS